MKYLRIFLSLFKRKTNSSETPTSSNIPIKLPDAVNTIPLKSGIKKIAILVGHGAGDSGATAFNGIEEHDYNIRVAEILNNSYLGKDIKIFYKTSKGWIPTYLQIAVFNPDLTIELHLNAASGTAIGCEVLCIDKESAIIGRSFTSAFCKKFNRKARRELGINFISSGDRGYGNLKGCKAIAKQSILVEPFFCDNKNEWIEPSEYATFVCEWIRGI